MERRSYVHETADQRDYLAMASLVEVWAMPHKAVQPELLPRMQQQRLKERHHRFERRLEQRLRERW